MEAKAKSDAHFGESLERAHSEYAEERSSYMPQDAEVGPSGGVGGTAIGVKCLHAHYAHSRAGHTNPVGTLVGAWIEPLDCAEPCVVDGEKNPAWVNRP